MSNEMTTEAYSVLEKTLLDRRKVFFSAGDKQWKAHEKAYRIVCPNWLKEEAKIIYDETSYDRKTRQGITLIWPVHKIFREQAVTPWSGSKIPKSELLFEIALRILRSKMNAMTQHEQNSFGNMSFLREVG